MDGQQIITTDIVVNVVIHLLKRDFQDSNLHVTPDKEKNNIIIVK